MVGAGVGLAFLPKQDSEDCKSLCDMEGSQTSLDKALVAFALASLTYVFVQCPLWTTNSIKQAQLQTWIKRVDVIKQLVQQRRLVA